MTRPALLFAVLFVSAVLRFWGLGDESYWFDEIWSVTQVRGSLSDVLRSLAHSDVHPPLYTFLLWGWVRALGEAEWATRLLSALVGLLAVAVTERLATELDRDRRTGLIAAGAVGLSAFAVTYAQETRSYSLLLLLSVLATWRLVRLLDAPASWRAAGLYVLAALLLVYTHVFGAFVLLAHGLFVLRWVPVLRLRVVALGAIVVVGFLPWVPVMLAQVGRVQQGFWIPRLDWRSPFFWLWTWGGYGIPAILVWLVAVARGAAVPAPVTDGWRAKSRTLLALLAGVPVVLPVVLSIVGEPIFHPKYAIVLLGPLAILAARGVLAVRRPAWRFGALSAAAIVLLSSVVLHVTLPRTKEQWRELSAHARALSTQGVVVVAEAYNRTNLGFYGPDLAVRWLEPGDDSVQTLEGVSELVYVQCHPAKGEHSEALDRAFHRVDEVSFRDARAVRYRRR